MMNFKQLAVGVAALVLSATSFAAELHLYAGAGLRIPVDKVVADFEKETGHKVIVEYGGSGQLLTRFNLTQEGDLFMPGSLDYIEKLKDKATGVYPLVLHTPAFVVRNDTGKDVHTFADFAKSDLKLGLGDPKAIALGKSGATLIKNSGFEKELQDKVVVHASTIKQLLLYVLNGDVDGAIIGRSDAVKHSDVLHIIAAPEGTPEEIAAVATLSTSADPALAKQLAEKFASKEGIKAFTDAGFLPVEP